MFCYKCGTQLAEDAAFCHSCGTKLIVNDVQPMPIQPVLTPPPVAGMAEQVVDAHTPPAAVSEPIESIHTPNTPVSTVVQDAPTPLVVTREKQSAFIQKTDVIIDGNRVGELSSGGTLGHRIMPGTHCITAKTANRLSDDSIHIWIEVPKGNVSVSFNCGYDRSLGTLYLNCNQENLVIPAPPNLLSDTEIRCPDCGKKLPHIMDICPACGMVIGKQDKNKLISIAKFCKILSSFKIADAVVFVIIALVQIGYRGIDHFFRDWDSAIPLLWNVVIAVGSIYIAAKLWPDKHIRHFNQFGKYEQTEIGKYIGLHSVISIAIFFSYMHQVISNQAGILVLMIMLEIIAFIITALVFGKLDKSSRSALWSAIKNLGNMGG